MKKTIIILLSLFLLFSCDNKSKRCYVVAEQLLQDKSDPLRFKNAIAAIRNAPKEEYKKYNTEINAITKKIMADYTLTEKEKFLEEYGKTKVAFVERSSNLFIMNLDGTEKEQLTSGLLDGKRLFIKNIRWSPDGKYIVFNHALDNSNIVLVNVETKEVSWLTKLDKDSWPTWSPDSQKVLFFRETGNQIISIDINTKKETVLYAPREYPGICPFYLPNGKDIAFNRLFQLQVLREGETEPEILINPGSMKNKANLSSALATGTFEYGCSSNTGQYILTNGYGPYIFKLDGTLVAKTIGSYGTWSYDDKYIMFNTSDDNGNQSYSVSPLFQDPDMLYLEIPLGLGYYAAWCPQPPLDSE